MWEVVEAIVADPDIASMKSLKPYGKVALTIREWLIAVIEVRKAHANTARVIQVRASVCAVHALVGRCVRDS